MEEGIVDAKKNIKPIAKICKIGTAWMKFDPKSSLTTGFEININNKNASTNTITKPKVFIEKDRAFSLVSNDEKRGARTLVKFPPN